MDGASIDVHYGRARVEIESDVSGAYSEPVLNELKQAIVTVCIAMDTEASRLLATRVEGTP